jgi:Bcr/CflA subfamily drug resistance transporter
VYVLVALGQIAIDLYLPSFADIATHLNTTPGGVKLTMTLFLIGYSLSQLIYGPLSDRWGRRPVLLTGIAIFLAGCLGSIYSTSINELLISRLVQGLGIGASNVLARAILRDTFEGRELVRKFSYVGLAWVTVPIIAPVIGGYIQDYFAWRMNFVLLGILAATVWIVVLFSLPETKNLEELHSIHPKAIANNYLKLLSHKSSLGYILSAFPLYGVFVSLYTAGPFLLLTGLKLTPVQFGWMMVIASSGFLIGSFLNTLFLYRWEPKKAIWTGLLSALAISGIMFSIAVSGLFDVSSIIAPMFFLFLSIALIYPNCLSGGLSAFPQLAGSASALFGCSAFLGGVLTSAVISALSDRTQLDFTIIVLIQCVMAFLLLWNFVLKKQHRV